jgi:hypothetical protein
MEKISILHSQKWTPKTNRQKGSSFLVSTVKDFLERYCEQKFLSQISVHEAESLNHPKPVIPQFLHSVCGQFSGMILRIPDKFHQSSG